VKCGENNRFETLRVCLLQFPWLQFGEVAVGFDDDFYPVVQPFAELCLAAGDDNERSVEGSMKKHGCQPEARANSSNGCCIVIEKLQVPGVERCRNRQLFA
jgi:hypothetical protein